MRALPGSVLSEFLQTLNFCWFKFLKKGKRGAKDKHDLQDFWDWQEFAYSQGP
jgi:hypothetical protein